MPWAQSTVKLLFKCSNTNFIVWTHLVYPHATWNSDTFETIKLTNRRTYLCGARYLLRFLKILNGMNTRKTVADHLSCLLFFYKKKIFQNETHTTNQMSPTYRRIFVLLWCDCSSKILFYHIETIGVCYSNNTKKTSNTIKCRSGVFCVPFEVFRIQPNRYKFQFLRMSFCVCISNLAHSHDSRDSNIYFLELRSLALDGCYIFRRYFTKLN